MKKVLGLAAALVVVLGAAALMAQGGETTAEKTSVQKAEEICKAKNLVGDALKKCIDEETKKLEATK